MREVGEGGDDTSTRVEHHHGSTCIRISSNLEVWGR